MSGVRGAVLIGGTSSDAGKSLVVAGLCRALVRAGVRVAPFKAQNMSNNSVVTLDGGEIGRAQALQAYACGLEPSTRFNPVLLKPGGDRRSHVIVRGRPAGDVGAADYIRRRARLLEVVTDELRSLREDFDVVICEGAGSVAEVNLRDTDIANMGLAQAADLPVLLVTDIDRGGSLAHLFGTTAILDATDQARIAGYVVNKFRGDPSILAPGLDQLYAISGRPTLGVVPFDGDLWIDAEDSLASPVGRRVGPPAAGRNADDGTGAIRLRVAAIRLPRLSNSTDVEALACEPGVEVTWVDDPASVVAADLAVLPGTRATVADLAWLRTAGLDAALRTRAAEDRPTLAICGGFQMFGRRIRDGVESTTGPAQVDGLGIFDLDVEFRADKVVRRVAGLADGHRVGGYEIHHGTVVRSGEESWLVDDERGGEGARRGALFGTHWHGLLASDAFRRDFLREIARRSGKPEFEPASDTRVDDVRAAQVDRIADLLAAHVDLDAVVAILTSGGTAGLPTITHSLEQRTS
ncbi:cobyric acid synthase [Gordonia sp. DT219]|uniref:cobyric acid synthase n=1 Tax=Gordonia sp. DT219 TaxID=3416658 RepID=UPI003CEEDFCA